MSEVNSINGMKTIGMVNRRPTSVEQAPARAEHGAPRDEVEISEVGALLAKLGELPDMRVEKIAHLRAEIEQGSFETAERLEGTVERLLAELEQL